MFAAIANALAPSGATLEEAAARAAVDVVLLELYEEFVRDGSLEALARLPEARVAAAVEQSVAAYIYQRWLQELGVSIERGDISEAKAVALEREMKPYVEEMVKLELGERTALDIDWKSEGQAIVEDLFRDAYSMLGATE